MILFIRFIYWRLIDFYRNIRDKPQPHLFGIKCICGMYGQGKTMAMSYIATKFKKKYGDDIYISSNYGLAIQDFPFNDISLLSKEFDKPVVFLFDEVQNTFPSNERNFPRSVLKSLTFNRKGNGKLIYWSSQDHELVHKAFRRLTIEYGQVRTIRKRFTRIRWYLPADYQSLFEQNNYDKKMKIHPIKKDKFIQTDYIRNLYNSYSFDNGEILQDEKGLMKMK